jgi:hypothetical protein
METEFSWNGAEGLRFQVHGGDGGGSSSSSSSSSSNGLLD